MRKPLEPPEHLNRASENRRAIFDAGVSIIPWAGPVFATAGRQLVPSEQDKARASWTQDVGDRINDHDDRLGGVETRTATIEKGLHALSAPPPPIAVDALGGAVLRAQRELIRQGRPRTALEQLQVTCGAPDAAAHLSALLLAQATSLMGTCRLLLGQEAAAAALFAEALDLDASNPEVIANAVTGLLIEERPDAARALAEQALAEHLASPHLASARLRVALASGEPNPLPTPHPAARADADVAGLLVMLALRDGAADWADQARRALARHPEDRLVRRLAAEADLIEALHARARDASQPDVATMAQASRAAEVLEALWRETATSERAVGEVALVTLHNALLAHRVADRASQALSLADEARETVERDPRLRRLALTIALDQDAQDAVDRLLAASPVVDPVLRLEIALRREDFAEALRIIEEAPDALAADEGLLTPELLARGLRAALVPAAEREAALLALLEPPGPGDPPDADVQACLWVASLARRTGAPEAGRCAFARAREIARGSVPFELRHQLAGEARLRGEPNSVIDALDGHLVLSRATPERLWLAEAHADAEPPRRSGVAFFQGIRAASGVAGMPHATPQIDVAEGVFHLNRNQPQDALAPLRRAHRDNPRDARRLLLLCEALRANGRAGEADALLGGTDPKSVEGTPAARTAVARLLVAAGHPEALASAYDLAVAHHDRDPHVCLGYAQIFLDAILAGRALPVEPPETVALGAWVRLERDYGEPIETVIAPASEPARGRWAADHPVLAAALGRRTGETFEVAIGPLPTLWRVAALDAPERRLFHEVVEHLQTRFPGFVSIHTIHHRIGDNLEPLIQVTRQQDEARQGPVTAKLCDLAI